MNGNVNALEAKVEHLTTGKVATRYGVTPMTIFRWTGDEHLGFPKPIYINNRKYWSDSELDAWERSRARCAA